MTLSLSNIKKVCVLLPTYNGTRYVVDQLQTILDQDSVEVTVFVSDDCSTDGTVELINRTFPSEKRIKIWPSIKRHGSAGKNFYTLISSVDFSGYDYVSLADQDDLWNLDKLQTSIDALVTHDASGVSSDVVAFWEDGRSAYVRKSLSQKKYDFLFEPAGPGCTYVMTVDFANQLKKLLENQAIYEHVFNHDWLIYAYARVSGHPWHIISQSTMWYRQHQNNETGVNQGFAAIKTRIQKLRSGFYLNQVYAVSEAVGRVDLLNLFFLRRGVPRLDFFKNLFQMRRSNKEAVLWALFLLFRIPK